MNNIKHLMVGAALLCMCAVQAFAQSTPLLTAQYGFSLGSTNPATALSYAIVSANSANNGAPVITFLSADSDLAASKIQFYKVDALTVANYTNATVTLPVGSTNNIADGGKIIIRHVQNDTYEKRILTTSTGSTNLVVTVAPLGAVLPGDIIYHVVTTGAGQLRWGASTNTLAGTRIHTGQAGYPLLLEIDGTSLAGLNLVSGYYQSVER